MINEKLSLKNEVVYADETKQHRYLWTQIWDKNKPMACVIMLNPCVADGLVLDTSTYLVVNNIASLEKYGGVHIVNIFSKLTNKLNLRWDSDEELNGSDNDTYIRKAVAEAETVICAWGTGAITNKRVLARVNTILAQLKEFSEKLYVITDGEELRGVHPLTPAVRNRWILQPLEARDMEPKVNPKVAKLKEVLAENTDEKEIDEAVEDAVDADEAPTDR